MGARCCRPVHVHGTHNEATAHQDHERSGRPPLPPELFQPDRPAAARAGLRRPAPVRARLGGTVYHKLAESTEYGIAEYAAVPDARHARAEK